ncbi:MAG TPA: ABC transporter ATP-binding protein [Candidatus Binatia bacterium]|nr:ABC transporter ATP-binding protein [Candidatus Binatia bacterium]
MIVAEQLAKRFGTQAAVADVSFHVARGEVVGMLGPNGAGKTTTLRMLAGVFPPTAGRALVDGHDVARAPRAARRRVGYAPERPALHLEMTVEGALAFAAALREVAPRGRRAAVDLAVERAGLDAVRRRRLGALSKGFRQRVGLALALVGDPPALVLDEPLVGLDPAQGAEARRLLRTLAPDHAVLISSHVLAEIETLCDRVVVLHRGHVLAAGTPAALAARLRPATRVEVEVEAPAAALVAALGAVEGVRRVEALGNANGHARCRVEAGRDRDVRPALAERVLRAGWALRELRTVEPSLEEAFLALVGADDA